MFLPPSRPLSVPVSALKANLQPALRDVGIGHAGNPNVKH